MGNTLLSHILWCIMSFFLKTILLKKKHEIEKEKKGEFNVFSPSNIEKL